MSRNRNLAAAFGVLAVTWSLGGAFLLASNVESIEINTRVGLWILNVLILIFIPLIRGVARWTSLEAGIIGIIALIVKAVEIFTSPLSKVETINRISLRSFIRFLCLSSLPRRNIYLKPFTDL